MRLGIKNAKVLDVEEVTFPGDNGKEIRYANVTVHAGGTVVMTVGFWLQEGKGKAPTPAPKVDQVIPWLPLRCNAKATEAGKPYLNWTAVKLDKAGE